MLRREQHSGGPLVNPEDSSTPIDQPYLPYLPDKIGEAAMAERIDDDPVSHRRVHNLVRISGILSTKSRAIDWAWNFATLSVLFSIAGLAMILFSIAGLTFFGL